MRKTGKIIASISSGFCFVVSLGMILYVVYLTVLGESLQNASSGNLMEMNDAQQRIVDQLADGTVQDTYFGEFNRHGTIGIVTSAITFIACFITLPKMKYLFPSIAAGSAVVGAILCGWLIMSFMLVALVGVGLILLSHYLESKKVEQP